MCVSFGIDCMTTVLKTNKEEVCTLTSFLYAEPFKCGQKFHWPRSGLIDMLYAHKCPRFFSLFTSWSLVTLYQYLVISASLTRKSGLPYKENV